MRICKDRLDVVMARRCMSRSDLRAVISPQTVTRIFRDPEKEIRTKTVGKIAAALGVDVLDILDTGGEAGHAKTT